MAYKYTKEKNAYSANFLRFNDKEVKELVVNGWDFTKGNAGQLFRCYVEEENGEKVDKIWTVFDYESAELLKKKLGVKQTGNKKLKVKRVLNDEDDVCYELM